MTKIRLYDEAYRSGHAFSITIATRMRRPYFAGPEAAPIALQALRESAESHDAAVFAYCFMPNHAHLLAATPSERALNLSGPFWQTRYFDHALRQEESLETVASYIWENPVRAGLVAEARDHRYSGSLAFPDAFSSGAEAPDLLLLRRARRPT